MVRVFEVSNEIQGNQCKMCEGVRLLIGISGAGMGVNEGREFKNCLNFLKRQTLSKVFSSATGCFGHIGNRA